MGDPPTLCLTEDHEEFAETTDAAVACCVTVTGVPLVEGNASIFLLWPRQSALMPRRGWSEPKAFL